MVVFAGRSGNRWNEAHVFKYRCGKNGSNTKRAKDQTDYVRIPLLYKKTGSPSEPPALIDSPSDLLFIFHARCRATIFLHQAAGDIRASTTIAGMHQYVFGVFAGAFGFNGG